MSDLAAVLFPRKGCKSCSLSQMEVPVLFEGQICLVGIRDFSSILQQLDSDVRGMKLTHIANQDVLLSKLSWFMAVHLNLGRSYRVNTENKILSNYTEAPCAILLLFFCFHTRNLKAELKKIFFGSCFF